MAPAFAFEDLSLALHAGIGIAIYPDDGEDPTTLLDVADQAMYAEKRRKPGPARR